MSSYKFSCPICEQHIEAPADMLGETVDCPNCNTSITLPNLIPPTLPAAKNPAQTKPIIKKTAPGAKESLTWGILGIFFCGVILGCVAISNANSAKKLIEQRPDIYKGGGLATAGLVMGIIDLVASGIGLLIGIVSTMEG